MRLISFNQIRNSKEFKDFAKKNKDLTLSKKLELFVKQNYLGRIK